MKRLAFDIETNGLYEDATTIHCLCLRDIDTGEHMSCADKPGYTPIKEGIEELKKATMLIGHNIISFDVPVLKKIKGVDLQHIQMFDTFIASQLIYGDLDRWRAEVGEGISRKVPKNMWYKHSLAAWGHRMGVHKGDYEGPWTVWSKEMQIYCEQDVNVSTKLGLFLLSKNTDQRALDLEMKFAQVAQRIEKHGFGFDREKAVELYGELTDQKKTLEEELIATFGTWVEPDGLVIPKKTIKYKDPSRISPIKDVQYTRIKYITFNPGSRAHIINRLKEKYNWRPEKFTEKGAAKMDSDVLETLPYEEGPSLFRYAMLQKRLQALATAKKAWLKILTPQDRLHGGMMSCGTITGRVSHHSPNLGNITANNKEYGTEIRALFRAAPGKKLVGADASGLELRVLAGYLKAYDNGAYIHSVQFGTQEDKTDVHSMNAEAMNITRASAKTVIYAMIYGGGLEKLGKITLGDKESEAVLMEEGRRLKAAIWDTIEGLEKLTNKTKRVFNEVGYIKGLDGRKLYPAKDYSSLNTLIQSAGALIMKQATIILDNTLQHNNLVPGDDYEFVGFIHDELQIECKPEWAERIGKAAVKSMEAAGKKFDFPCPITGEYKVGNNWSETH